MTRHRHSDSPRQDAGASDDENGAGATPGRGDTGATQRVDKWLWCTRFFRSRGLAQQAVEGGHVQVNGDRVKASRLVKVGDRLLITRAQERYEVDVVAVPSRRGPAPEARAHYRETTESEAARAHVRELNRLSGPVSAGRPDKRERRDLLRLTRGGSVGSGGVSDDGDAD